MSSSVFMIGVAEPARVATIGLSATVSPRVQAAAPEFESEPTLKIADFRGLPAAKRTGFRVESTVPVSGYRGPFILHSEVGDVKADRAGMLKQRIAEVGPTVQLRKLPHSDVFVDALSKSAQSGAKAVGTALVHPVDTAAGVPAAVGRFFKSVGQDVKNAVSRSSKGDTIGAVEDALGINKANAKKVGVDPYTTNPNLSERLDELANAAFAGGVSLGVVLAVAPAGVATAISVTTTVSNVAWNLPPEHVRQRNDKDLRVSKVDAATGARPLNNRWYTPSMALMFVETIKALGVREGANASTALAAGAQSES